MEIGPSTDGNGKIIRFFPSPTRQITIPTVKFCLPITEEAERIGYGDTDMGTYKKSPSFIPVSLSFIAVSLSP
jgi:hypothetical protein